MKKIVVILGVLVGIAYCTVISVQAQTIANNNISITIECRKNYDSSVSKLKNIVDSTHSVITYRYEKAINDGKRQLTLTISSDNNGYSAINKKLQTLGKITNYTITTSGKNIDTLSMSSNLSINNNKKNKLLKMLDTMKVSNSDYNNYWTQVNTINSQLSLLTEQMKDIKEQIQRPYSFSVNIYEFSETNFVSSSKNQRALSIVGAGYCLYNITNSRKEISNTSFQGPFIRYSNSLCRLHLEVGLMKGKEYNDTMNTAAINKLLTIQVGQIFYPRYFGRGNLKFFNVFAGYDFGLVFANSKEKMSTFCQLAPNVGFEIFKYKYLFIDAKAGYKLSLYKLQFLSGPFFSGSFNFIF